jgi:hypothetical protein
VLQQSGARMLLVSPALATIQDSLPPVEALVAEPDWRQFAHLSSSNPALRSGVDSAIFLLFTSGVLNPQLRLQSWCMVLFQSCNCP